jgi:hypothetical protein
VKHEATSVSANPRGSHMAVHVVSTAAWLTHPLTHPAHTNTLRWQGSAIEVPQAKLCAAWGVPGNPAAQEPRQQ